MNGCDRNTDTKLNILYLSTMCSESTYRSLFENSKHKPGQAVLKYHRLLANGLCCQKETEVFAISSLPINRINTPGWVIRKHRDIVGGVDTIYPFLVNLPVVKNIILLIETLLIGGQYIHKAKQKGDKAVIAYDGLINTLSIAALILARLNRVKCLCILTDVPGIMVGSKRRNGELSRIKKADSYLFLTEQMNDLLNVHHRPYIVQEGYCDVRLTDISNNIADKYPKFTFMYTGSIYKIYGIKLLTEAFLSCNFEAAELHIYGDGDYAEELKEICKANKSVKYFGNVLIDEVVEAQRRCDVLINPRFSGEEYTKYSFPSKNMEYMASGTAVLTTKLPGMPKEYLDYVYCFDSEDMNGFAAKLKEMVDIGREKLNVFGMRGKAFVIKEKTNEVQGEKIVRFIIDEVMN